MAKTLNEWARDIHQNAVEHGWWDEPRSFGDIVALCHSELSEALEEYRNGKPMIYGCCGHCDKETQCEVDGKPEHSCKPEGIATEMVDCLIRILDWCGKEGVDVEAVLAQKHEYNRTRPYATEGKHCEDRRLSAAGAGDFRRDGRDQRPEPEKKGTQTRLRRNGDIHPSAGAVPCGGF